MNGSCIRAKLVRHEVPGTPIGLRKHVPLGTIYHIFPDTTKPMKWGDKHHPGQEFELQTVYGFRIVDFPSDGWLPLDLFEIVPEDISA